MTVNRFYYCVCGGRVSDDIKAVYILGCAILMLMDHWVFTWNLCVCVCYQTVSYVWPCGRFGCMCFYSLELTYVTPVCNTPVWAERGCIQGRGAWKRGRRCRTAAGSTRCSCRRWPNPPPRSPGRHEHPTGWTIPTCRSLEYNVENFRWRRASQLTAHRC